MYPVFRCANIGGIDMHDIDLGLVWANITFWFEYLDLWVTLCVVCWFGTLGIWYPVMWLMEGSNTLIESRVAWTEIATGLWLLIWSVIIMFINLAGNNTMQQGEAFLYLLAGVFVHVLLVITAVIELIRDYLTLRRYWEERLACKSQPGVT